MDIVYAPSDISISHLVVNGGSVKGCPTSQEDVLVNEDYDNVQLLSYAGDKTCTRTLSVNRLLPRIVTSSNSTDSIYKWPSSAFSEYFVVTIDSESYI